LETLEKRIEQELKENILGTTLISEIIPFTIAAAFHGNDDDHKRGFYDTKYMDIRKGKDFIYHMLECIFEKAEGIAEDNMYEANKEAERIREYAKPVENKDVKKALLKKADEVDVPFEWWKVPMLGYYSSKFDLNLILKELNCKEWTVLPNELMVGGVISFKRLR
jgi:hypothetical protein